MQVATVNIAGSILNVSNRRVNFFEEVVKTTATPQELIEAKERKSAYQRLSSCHPAITKRDLIVRDPKTGAGGVRHHWLHRAKVRCDPVHVIADFGLRAGICELTRQLRINS